MKLMITIVLMLTLAAMTIVIEVMIAIVRMIVMDAHICTIVNRMMPTSWYWEPLVATRGHTAGQTAPHPRITCFLSRQNGSGGPSEVVPHPKDSIRPPFQLEKES